MANSSFRTFSVGELESRWNVDRLKIMGWMMSDPKFPLPASKTRHGPIWNGADIFNWEHPRQKMIRGAQ
jgi:hypothetical protein